MLLPEDAPRSPDIRIIGRDDEPVGTAAAASTPPPPAEAPAPTKDDVLYIGPEENVLYIGPDTMPPGSSGAGLRRRLRNLARQAPGRGCRKASERTRSASRTGWFGRGRAAASSSTVAAALLTPPAPIAPRQRVADLAGSLLGAAPLAVIAALVSYPAFELFDTRTGDDPLQLAFLFAMALLGSWVVLIPAQARERSPSARGVATRSPFLLSGLVLGGLALAFGTTFALTRWANLTARGRKARFRFWPVFQVAAFGGLVALVTPWIQPWAFVVVVLVAIIVQVVSPWRREAAQYEAALARAGGRSQTAA
jgi:hypothetical protein